MDPLFYLIIRLVCIRNYSENVVIEFCKTIENGCFSMKKMISITSTLEIDDSVQETIYRLVNAVAPPFDDFLNSSYLCHLKTVPHLIMLLLQTALPHNFLFFFMNFYSSYEYIAQRVYI